MHTKYFATKREWTGEKMKKEEKKLCSTASVLSRCNSNSSFARSICINCMNLCCVRIYFMLLGCFVFSRFSFFSFQLCFSFLCCCCFWFILWCMWRKQANWLIEQLKCAHKKEYALPPSCAQSLHRSLTCSLWTYTTPLLEEVERRSTSAWKCI